MRTFSEQGQPSRQPTTTLAASPDAVISAPRERVPADARRCGAPGDLASRPADETLLATSRRRGTVATGGRGSARRPRGEAAAGDLLLVVVGADMGAYALVRAFHEAYGCTAVAVVPEVVRPVRHSALLRPVVVPGLEDDGEVLVAALEDIAAQHPGRTRLLLTDADWSVRAVVTQARRLSRHYLLPYCTERALDQVSRKDRFAELCDRLGVRTPVTVPVDLAALRAAGGRAALADVRVDLDFPVVAKPASSQEYRRLRMPGKQKLDHLATRAELDGLLGRLLDAGFEGTYLVQEVVGGDETHVRSMTVYRDTRGAVTLAATGRVLLHQHAPDLLGVPAAIVVEPCDEAVVTVTRLLEAAGYTGFANVDYKLDPRTGQYVYFEINPRIGGNNYYLTAAGANPARALVADLVEHRSTTTVRTTTATLYSVVPFGLLMRYITDPALRRRLRRLRRDRQVVHPFRYRGDNGLRRRLVVAAMTQSHRYKFRRYYPRPTPDGF